MLPALRSRVWPPALLGSLALVGPGNTSLTRPRWSCPRRFWKGMWGPPCLARRRCPALTSSRDERGARTPPSKTVSVGPFPCPCGFRNEACCHLYFEESPFPEGFTYFGMCHNTVYPSSPELNLLS